MSVTESGPGIEQIKKGIAFLASHRLLVGIPESHNAARGDDENSISNVALAFLHTQGSPRMHIPPRPFIEPGVEAEKDRLADMMAQAVVMALDGNEGGAVSQMHMAGIVAENSIKQYMGSGALAPNAPSTIRKKHSSAPLIDTHVLQASITHVVEGE